MSESPQITVPLEVLQKLSGPAEQLGIQLPGVSRFAPSIDVTAPIRNLALELGRLLSGRNIFLKPSGDIVTVEDATGEEKLMTPRRLPAWAEEFCAFRAPGTRRVRDSLPVDDAAQILETDIFRSCLRRLNAVHLMRLPVRRSDGSIEFLSPGYDTESGTYTVETIKYDMEWSLEQGVDWLVDVCHEFPWNGLEEVHTDRLAAVKANRSFSVHVFALLATYCKAMFPEGTLRPMICYFANKPGSGKTRLAEMALSCVYGLVGGTTVPKDEEKLDVKLETIARSMQPWVIFDDVGKRLHSSALNKFLTEARHKGRCFNSNSEFFDVPNVTQMLVTANEIPTSEDLGRRALIAEFFLAEEVRGRKFKRTITPTWLAAAETRAQFLSALCAIVKQWLANPLLHGAPLETFDDFTRDIGGIVLAAGFADPLARPEMDVGGATQEDEIKQLLIELASIKEVDCVIPRAELVKEARTLGLLGDLLGEEGDPEPDADVLKRLGRRLQRFRGQKLRDRRGRTFQFSHKKKNTGATYPLVFLAE